MADRCLCDTGFDEDVNLDFLRQLFGIPVSFKLYLCREISHFDTKYVSDEETRTALSNVANKMYYRILIFSER